MTSVIERGSGRKIRATRFLEPCLGPSQGVDRAGNAVDPDQAEGSAVSLSDEVKP